MSGRYMVRNTKSGWAGVDTTSRAVRGFSVRSLQKDMIIIRCEEATVRQV